MWNIYEHLDKISKRPWMFIWDNSIISLRLYILWYYWCLNEKEFIENEIPSFHNFHDWVAKKYWYKESTSWWANMILDQTKDEKKALEKFFELLSEYKNEFGDMP
ncbi:MAG: hypothetical protein ACD_3C00103G0002 [uncultured bacterium (gcode 4)]|uniref:Uncharacterized protein n=1 Tax=uncultured bacterium (gcode 4) TaxID=1234023 RepID=K2G1K1_9BACT|nr:MAG: hypothetical protein ACD_3C00103G0002 [uncultured bacterium (gcode 4)]